MSSRAGQGDVIVEIPQPCAKCGEAGHIVLKEGRRLCARCYREERSRDTPPPAA
jgi:hypothetical protein